MSKRMSPESPDGQGPESTDGQAADSPGASSDSLPGASESNQTPETPEEGAPRPSSSGLVIHTNVSSLLARANLAHSDNSLAASLERLSAGLRVGQGATGSSANEGEAGEGEAGEGEASGPYASRPRLGTRLDRRV